jgi:predicted lipoprotein with Yx(FWY)xxD motif
MTRSIGFRRIGLLLAMAAALAVVAATMISRSDAASSAAAPSKVVVKAAKSRALGKTILVTRSGRTLYSLSVETHGRFICTTKLCLSLWKPLVVPRGTKPAGAQSLATVRRPDGRTQVSYRGRPLYTFVEDMKRGDVKGNGFKDVGIWLVASPSAAKTAPPPTTDPGYGGYGGYGG